MTATRDTLTRFRAEFPTLESSTYLISNSLGAMPRAARRDLEAYADTWTSRGVRAWAERWWTLAGEVGNTIGELFGAEPGTVSMHQNVTIAQAILISCFDWSGSRNKVVYTDMQFPSIAYIYDRLARPLGANIHVVNSPDGIGVPTEAVLDAIDENTLLVPISHVLFRSSYIQDANAICEKAERVGAHVVLDAYQSIGTVPTDVQELRCSFLVGGVLKWLCGGPGGAYLYVRPDLRDVLEPKFTGWMAHPQPFAFEGAPIKYTDGAYRYLNGTPNVPGLYAAQAGPKIVLEAGIDAIRTASMTQTAHLVARADEKGWRVTAPRDPNRRGGTVAVDVPQAAAVKLELLERDVIVDYRPGAGIRISPHFYNTLEECDYAIDQIDDILQSGAWKRHAESTPTVT